MAKVINIGRIPGQEELVKYGQEQAKARGVRHKQIHNPSLWFGGGIPGAEAVLEDARRLYPGLKLSTDSLRTWTKRGLIPRPWVVSLGKGEDGKSRGTQAFHPLDTPRQLATAAHLQAQGYKQREIAEAREAFLSGASERGDPCLEAYGRVYRQILD